MATSIEVTFTTPTAKDYAVATRWISRRALGPYYWLHIGATVIVALIAAYGFVMLLDAAAGDTAVPGKADQGLTGAIIFIAGLYAALLLKFFMRRVHGKNLYIADGFYLAQRTITLTTDGVQSNGGMQQMFIPWKNIIGIFENRHLLFLQFEPALTLFIPKRTARDPAEIARLSEAAEKLRTESIAKA